MKSLSFLAHGMGTKAVYEFEGVFIMHVNPQTGEVRRGKSVKALFRTDLFIPWKSCYIW